MLNSEKSNYQGKSQSKTRNVRDLYLKKQQQQKSKHDKNKDKCKQIECVREIN